MTFKKQTAISTADSNIISYEISKHHGHHHHHHHRSNENRSNYEVPLYKRA